LAGIDPPDSITVDPPASARSEPPQVLLGFPETTTPLGNVSVRAAVILAAVELSLPNTIVSVEMPPAVILAGLKDLLSVGGVFGATAHTEMETMFESMVTAPFCARALPDKVALVVKVMLARARILPTKLVPVPMVAELPTCHETLHADAPLISNTEALLAVMRVLPTLKIQAALGSPPALRVSCPVN
jgi:hypothetical protein